MDPGHRYHVFGVGVQSALPLPELLPGTAAAEVSIRLGRVERHPLQEAATPGGRRFRATAGEVYFWYESVGTFLVRGGDEIVVDPHPGVDMRLLRLFLLGPALALLLHRRGQLILHASAVAIHGGAAAFLGWRGSGKSTLAAALHAHGHSLMTDDVLALNVMGAERLLVFPGLPQLKLWAESIVALGGDPDGYPLLYSRSNKRAYSAVQGFSADPLPLKRIYVLSHDTPVAIEPLSPQAAFVEVLRHLFFVRMLSETGAGVAHVHQCAQLVSQIPIYRLQRPRDLALLPVVAQMVEEDLGGISA